MKSMEKYIQKIQRAIGSGKSYQEYQIYFQKYQNELEKFIMENPADLIGVCQLGAVYLEIRDPLEKSIGLLEEYRATYEEALDGESRARLYTNLAFFYQEEGDEKTGEEYLEKAVALNPDIPHAYDALGLLCIKAGELARGLEFFRQASERSFRIRYCYNYGVALYQIGRIAEAKDIFESLSLESEYEGAILYALGVCSSDFGEKTRGIELAHQLAALEDNDFIGESEIAELYYFCDCYQEHNEMYERSSVPYYPEASWLGPYFYSLKKMGRLEELKGKFEKICVEKEEEITELQNEELDEEFTALEQKLDILKYKEEKEAIEKIYGQIKNERKRPIVELKLEFIYGCYLIDCPRHQKLVELNL